MVKKRTRETSWRSITQVRTKATSLMIKLHILFLTLSLQSKNFMCILGTYRINTHVPIDLGKYCPNATLHFSLQEAISSIVQQLHVLSNRSGGDSDKLQVSEVLEHGLWFFPFNQSRVNQIRNQWRKTTLHQLCMEEIPLKKVHIYSRNAYIFRL